MIATNSMMLTVFVRGLHQTDSLTATISSAAVNFVFTGVVGRGVFQETLTALWWYGAGTILVGMMMIMYGDRQKLPESGSSSTSMKTKVE